MRRLTCGPPGPATRDPPRHGEESRTSLAVSGIAAVAQARCGFESRSAPSRPGRRRWPRRDATTIADGDGSRASKAPGDRIEHPRHSHPIPPFPPPSHDLFPVDTSTARNAVDDSFAASPPGSRRGISCLRNVEWHAGVRTSAPQAMPVNTCLQVQYVLCAELKGAQSRVSARTGIGMPRTNRRAIIPINSIGGNSMRSVIDSSTLTLTLDLQAGAKGGVGEGIWSCIFARTFAVSCL